jgi:hypothetical protein
MRPPSRPRLLALAVFSIALAACTTITPTPTPVPAPTPRPLPPPNAACTTCGRIERIDLAPTVSGARPRGAVLGGVVGGVLARPAPPTTTGAPAPTNGPRTYRLVVLLDGGRRLILTQPLAAGMKVGARVRVERSRAVLLR